MQRTVVALAMAAFVGLLRGTIFPSAEGLRPLALPLLFVQTLVAVGSLAEARSNTSLRWAGTMLVKHHLIASVPMLGLGLILGLDTWLGAGVFVLGAVPPAIAVPSYVAAFGGQVRPVIQFCMVGYGVGIVLTPLLAFLFLGSSGRVGSMILTLIFGLILPTGLGTLGRPWLSRMSRRTSFTVIALCVTVVMLSMGAKLRTAIELGLEQPALLAAAVAVGFGRCIWGAGLGWIWASADLKIESAIVCGCKNAVLAAIIAYGAFGTLAALPALVGLVAEAGILLAASLFRIPGTGGGSRPYMS